MASEPTSKEWGSPHPGPETSVYGVNMAARSAVHPVFPCLLYDAVVVLVNGEDYPHAVFVRDAGAGIGHVELDFGDRPSASGCAPA